MMSTVEFFPLGLTHADRIVYLRTIWYLYRTRCLMTKFIAKLSCSQCDVALTHYQAGIKIIILFALHSCLQP